MRLFQNYLGISCLITDRVSHELKQSVVSARPSARLSVRLFPLNLFNRLTFELEFLYILARLGLKVEVKGQS